MSIASFLRVANHETRTAGVARWRRIFVTADLLLIAALIGAGHLQSHAGQVHVLTPSIVDSFLGAPTVLGIVMGAAAFWIASPLPAALDGPARD